MTTFADHWRGRARSLATFGDSITEATHIAPPDARWSNILAADLGAALSNRGLSGTTLQNSPMHTGAPRPGNGVDRFEADLLGPHRADVIAILYGFNDARYTGAPETFNHDGFVRDYRHILMSLFAAGYEPGAIVLGSPAYLPDIGFSVGSEGFTGQSRAEFQRHARTVEKLARDFGTFYAPVNERMTAEGGDALISDDHVHPNAEGQARIAEAFAGATPSRDRFPK
ncbi:MAG TPA: SGNH/GDSL hydrolase family protein [Devosia sp.]|nr:SGNH/GDSL hydrolase family protein [Devosia sp.]